MVRIVDGMFESCIGPGRCRALGRLKKVGWMSYLIDHIHELSFGGVLSEGTHDSSKLLGGDCS